MYAWQLRSLVNYVAQDIKEQKDKHLRFKPEVLAQRRVRRFGITHKPDVSRLAKTICEKLNERSREKAAAKRAGREHMKRYSS